MNACVDCALVHNGRVRDLGHCSCRCHSHGRAPRHRTRPPRGAQSDTAAPPDPVADPTPRRRLPYLDEIEPVWRTRRWFR